MRRLYKTQKSCMRWVNEMGLDQGIDIVESLERLPAIAGVIIVQFLVHTLCCILESDNEKAMNICQSICESLYQLNLIEKIYETRENLSSQWNNKSINLQIWGILRKLPFFKHEPTTTITLLVESLVQLLWATVTPDFRKTMYSPRKICRFLHFKKIINKTYVMNEFEMMRHEYKRVVCNVFCVVRGERIPSEMEPVWQLTEHFNLEPLRYMKEFHEFNQIASGAFGEVFKVKHKLDGTTSAVKKIVLGDDWKSIITKMIEVSILAKLDHPNIVPYKAAWIETKVVPYYEDEDTESISSGCTTTLDTNIESTCSNRTTDSEFAFFKRGSQSQSSSNSTIIIDTKRLPYKLEMILLIQMSLCHMTLKEFLERQNNKALQINVAKDIFMQLLYALKYIRDQKIIHHDIKPSNILINFKGNQKLHIRLGDFGLACISQKGHTGEGFGTPLYAAPEQLKGQCTAKSDIYSLGIILLELLVPFSTKNELARTVENIHKGKFPESINDDFRNLLKTLIDKTPKQRPGVKKVITLMEKMGGNEKNELQQCLKERDVQIRKLKAQLVEKDKKITKLENQYKNAMKLIWATPVMAQAITNRNSF